MNKIFSFIIAAMLLMPVTSKAQTDFSFRADFVSSYMWRGVATAGASIQPAMGLTAGGFSIGTWGSVEVAGFGYKEVDLAIGYSVGGFSIGLTDYWWDGEGAFNYFKFKEDQHSHLLEVNLGYELESGLSFSWNTMVARTGDKYLDDSETKRAYSTYVEAGYSFDVKDVNLTASLGFNPWKSNVLYTDAYPYATDGLAVTNISLTASKSISISDRFSLPVFSQLAFNPATEDVFLVFGISF